MVPSDEHVRVVHDGVVLAQTHRAVRVLETSHAPAYYIPRDDVALDWLVPSQTVTVCEYKGVTTYGSIYVPNRFHIRDACWWFATPTPGYEAIRDAICFYPQKVDLCEVDGEAVTPLRSDFYGDWPTSRIAGPYKGAPGTEYW